MSYIVINHTNNTTTTKWAKSKAYLMWMYHHAYATQSDLCSCGWSVEHDSYVVEIH